MAGVGRHEVSSPLAQLGVSALTLTIGRAHDGFNDIFRRADVALRRSRQWRRDAAFRGLFESVAEFDETRFAAGHACEAHAKW
jgi:hypothetical protein